MDEDVSLSLEEQVNLLPTHNRPHTSKTKLFVAICLQGELACLGMTFEGAPLMRRDKE